MVKVMRRNVESLPEYNAAFEVSVETFGELKNIMETSGCEAVKISDYAVATEEAVLWNLID